MVERPAAPLDSRDMSVLSQRSTRVNQDEATAMTCLFLVIGTVGLFLLAALIGALFF